MSKASTTQQLLRHRLKYFLKNNPLFNLSDVLLVQ